MVNLIQLSWLSLFRRQGQGWDLEGYKELSIQLLEIATPERFLRTWRSWLWNAPCLTRMIGLQWRWWTWVSMALISLLPICEEKWMNLEDNIANLKLCHQFCRLYWTFWSHIWKAASHQSCWIHIHLPGSLWTLASRQELAVAQMSQLTALIAEILKLLLLRWPPPCYLDNQGNTSWRENCIYFKKQQHI